MWSMDDQVVKNTTWRLKVKYTVYICRRRFEVLWLAKLWAPLFLDDAIGVEAS